MNGIRFGRLAMLGGGFAPGAAPALAHTAGIGADEISSSAPRLDARFDYTHDHVSTEGNVLLGFESRCQRDAAR